MTHLKVAKRTHLVPELHRGHGSSRNNEIEEPIQTSDADNIERPAVRSLWMKTPISMV